MSKLLMDERPLVILPSLAKLIGLNQAIVIQQMHYWIQNKPNIRDGMRWTYNTYDGWQKQFPWWSTPTVKRTIIKLEEDGLLISTDKYNKMNLDKTKWYSINYDKLEEMQQPQEDLRADDMIPPSDQIDPSSGSNWTHPSDQIDPSNTLDYPETPSYIFPIRGDKLPSVQRATAFLFINQGKKEGLSQDDVDCMNLLFKIHTPAAIQKVILDSYDRIDKKGSVTCDGVTYTSKEDLPLRYVYNSMKNWTSLRRKGGAASGKSRGNPDRDQKDYTRGADKGLFAN